MYKERNKKLLEQFRREASRLREWLYNNAHPDVPIDEWAEVANQYAIICTKIWVIERQW